MQRGPLRPAAGPAGCAAPAALTRAGWLLVLALALLPACGEAVAAEPLAPGAPAPAFELPGRSDRPVSLAELRGKFVYLHFWSSWCPACQQSFSWLGDLQRRYAERGLVVVGVNVDARRADAEAFLGDHPAGFTVAFDPAARVPRSYEVRIMPSAWLIGPDGRIRLVQTGFTPKDQAGYERALRAELDARVPAAASATHHETAPLGRVAQSR